VLRSRKWPTYGNDAGSSRYSPLTEINRQNIRDLKLAWTYHTGDVARGDGTWNGQKIWAKSTSEATPLMVDDTLYIASSFNRIIALILKRAARSGLSTETRARLAQPSKMGHLFVLERDTGQPILPVEERPVPQNGVPGEWLRPPSPSR